MLQGDVQVASSSFRREVVLEEMTTQTMTKAKILTEEDQIIMERHLYVPNAFCLQ